MTAVTLIEEMRRENNELIARINVLINENIRLSEEVKVLSPVVSDVSVAVPNVAVIEDQVGPDASVVVHVPVPVVSVREDQVGPEKPKYVRLRCVKCGRFRSASGCKNSKCVPVDVPL